jgi:hypothetical protein
VASDLVLGIFAALGPIIGAVGGMRFHRQTKAKKELEVERERGAIGIDEATRNKLVQDAARLDQEREQKREEWWGSQIQMLRDEIEAERVLSNKRYRRLNQLENWAMSHVAWDRKAYTRLRETYPDFEEPPLLPEDFSAE